MLLVERVLVGVWLAYEVKTVAVAGSVRGEVAAGLSETEVAIGAAAYFTCVVVVLTLVLPEAHGTDLVHAAFPQGEVSTAGTCVRLGSRGAMYVEEHARIVSTCGRSRIRHLP
ncbi:MAG TPA: hypothetical protein VGP70_06960, partial [Actinomadura sp.]|nr:hypothetical protein [Actinomadura sp.]